MPREIEHYLRAGAFAAFATTAILIFVPTGMEKLLEYSILVFFLLWSGAMFLLPWQGISDAADELSRLTRALLERIKNGHNHKSPD